MVPKAWTCLYCQWPKALPYFTVCNTVLRSFPDVRVRGFVCVCVQARLRTHARMHAYAYGWIYQRTQNEIRMPYATLPDHFWTILDRFWTNIA